jgi:branched-chain amino acid transport system substrate-binding protein
MKKTALTAALSLMLAAAQGAEAKGLTIGVVAPDSGPFVLLGKQIMAGAKAQVEAAGNTILPVPETCEPESGVDVASRLIAGGASVAIGFLCADSLLGGAQALKDASIPVLTLSAQSKVLFEEAVKRGWPLYSLAPRPQEEALTTAGFITELWPNAAVALLDDGTINAHELAVNIRLALKDKGMKPVFADNFRPGLDSQKMLLRQLQKAGAAAVYVAGSRGDVAVIARDLAGTGIKVIGGEQLLAPDDAVPLPDGVLAVLPEIWRERPAASAVVQALAEQHIIAEGYVLPAHAAALIVDKAEAAVSGDRDLARTLANGSFDTAIGTVTFGKDHYRAENVLRLMEWRNGAFQPVQKTGQTQ